jgi:hypothetical protein
VTGIPALLCTRRILADVRGGRWARRVGVGAMSERLRSAAPIDLAALAGVLDAAGSGSMLPAGAYLDDAVLAWERTHLFAEAWVCAGRGSELADPGAAGTDDRRRRRAPGAR